MIFEFNYQKEDILPYIFVMSEPKAVVVVVEPEQPKADIVVEPEEPKAVEPEQPKADVVIVEQPKEDIPESVYAYPERIKMKGLPLMLCGWNKVFRRTNQMLDGAPVYLLNGYLLCRLFLIIGVKILRVNGVWQMQRVDDSEPMAIMKYGDAPQISPLGRWNHGAKIVMCNKKN